MSIATQEYSDTQNTLHNTAHWTQNTNISKSTPTSILESHGLTFEGKNTPYNTNTSFISNNTINNSNTINHDVNQNNKQSHYIPHMGINRENTRVKKNTRRGKKTITSAVEGMPVGDMRNALKKMREMWRENSPESPFYISSNLTDLHSIEAMAFQVTRGHSLKRREKGKHQKGKPAEDENTDKHNT